MPHLSESEIAHLIDGRCEPDEAARLHSHMAKCEPCREDYEFAARTRAQWQTEPSVFAGEDVPSAPRPTRSRRRWRLWSLAAAAAVAAAVLAVIYLPATDQGLDEESIAIIHGAMQSMSDRGLLVLPRTVENLQTSEDAFRSNAVVDDPRVMEVLRENADAEGREAMFWLAGGFLAVGEFEAARDVAARALQSDPDDDEVAVLHALALHHLGQADASREALYEVARSQSASDVAMINLAVVDLGEDLSEREARIVIDLSRIGGALGERAALVRRLSQD